MGSYKKARVSDLIHKELAKNINKSLDDPRLGLITISEVKVTPDLSIARVYVTVLEEDKQEISIALLKGAATFLRNSLACNLNLRRTPWLEFFYDHGLNNGRKMDALLDKIGLSSISSD